MADNLDNPLVTTGLEQLPLSVLPKDTYAHNGSSDEPWTHYLWVRGRRANHFATAPVICGCIAQLCLSNKVLSSFLYFSFSEKEYYDIYIFQPVTFILLSTKYV